MSPGLHPSIFTLTWILKLTSSYFVMLKGEFSGQKNSPKLSRNNSSQCFLNPLTIYLLAWEFHATSSCLINTKKLACLSKYYKTGFCILTLFSRIWTVNTISTPPKKSYNCISILPLFYSWAKSLTEKHPFCPNRGGGVYDLSKLVSAEEILGAGSFCVFLESLAQATRCFGPFLLVYLMTHSHNYNKPLFLLQVTNITINEYTKSRKRSSMCFQ